MLNLIFQKAKAQNQRVVIDSRPFFELNYDISWFKDEWVQEIIRTVDGSEVYIDDVLTDNLGKHITGHQISTGAKTAILVYKFKDIIFNMTQCGDNAFAFVVGMCKRENITCLTYRYLPMRFLKYVSLQKDYRDITLDEYDEKVDEWLDEIEND